MKVIARSTPKGYEVKMWLGDISPTIVRFILPENTVRAWQVALEKSQSEGWLSEIGEALRAGKVDFLSPYFDASNPDAVIERLAVCKLALAWNRVCRDATLNIEHLISAPSLRGLITTWPFAWLLQKPRYFLKEEWLVELNKITQENALEFLANFLPHLDLLRALIRERTHLQPSNAPEMMSKYAALLMAVLDFLNSIDTNWHQIAGHISSFYYFVQRYRPALWALLAENDVLPLDKRQYYIDLFFGTEVPERERWSYLVNVLEDLEEEVENDQTKQYVVETIASLMAQRYLDRYMPHRALHIWERVSHLRREPWLHIILMLHKTPGRWLAFTLFMLVIAWIFPWVGIFMLLASLTVFLVISSMAAIRFLRRQGFPFLELFLPRLAGAVIVGSSILALENTVWDISINMPLLSWIIVTTTSALGALAYIFLEVHKTKRLQSFEIEESERGNKDISSLMSRSIKIAGRFFSIGALEAVGINMLVTSFLPLDRQVSTIVRPFTLAVYHGMRFIAFKPYGVVVEGSINNVPLIRLTLFPKVVILWAGLSLLLGAFAQLLWQDRQITAS